MTRTDWISLILCSGWVAALLLVGARGLEIEAGDPWPWVEAGLNAAAIVFSGVLAIFVANLEWRRSRQERQLERHALEFRELQCLGIAIRTLNIEANQLIGIQRQGWTVPLLEWASEAIARSRRRLESVILRDLPSDDARWLYANLEATVLSIELDLRHTASELGEGREANTDLEGDLATLAIALASLDTLLERHGSDASHHAASSSTAA